MARNEKKDLRDQGGSERSDGIIRKQTEALGKLIRTYHPEGYKSLILVAASVAGAATLTFLGKG
ncbi:MAG: hypothetical protein AAB955_03705 [Patescibacteria group bacterium]